MEHRLSTTASIEASATKQAWQRGVTRAIPIVFGYVPIGFAYGVLALKSGLSPRNAVLMSLLVYAGASQFVAAGLFAAGASPLSIVLTTFVVNLRHLLLSASVAPHLTRWPRSVLLAFAYELTDETFAVHTARFAAGPPDRVEALCVNVVAQAAWICGSWLGVVGGQFIPDPRPWGLDYALPALFVALLVLQLQDRIQIGVALVAGLGAVCLDRIGLDQWAVVLAALVGATLGVIWERWMTKPSS
jgi:4-azaleucine resistance transporter AzlC